MSRKRRTNFEIVKSIFEGLFSMPECGELKTKGNRTFMWDCKHKEWVDVTPPPNYKQIYKPLR